MPNALRYDVDQPVHVDNTGSVFIGGQEFPYAIAADSIKVEQIRKGRNHLLTMTLIVGAVTMEQRTPREAQAGA